MLLWRKSIFLLGLDSSSEKERTDMKLENASMKQEIADIMQEIAYMKLEQDGMRFRDKYVNIWSSTFCWQ